ncbi:MAG: T9SS type A sorting domain-containing protein [Bacteroidota bacterium]
MTKKTTTHILTAFFMFFGHLSWADTFNSGGTVFLNTNVNGIVIENGTIVRVNGNIAVDAAIDITNGELIIEAGFSLNSTGGAITIKSDGTLNIEAGAMLTTNQDIVNDEGVLIVDGTLSGTDNGKKFENKAGGTVSGSGNITIAGNILNIDSSDFFGYTGNDPTGEDGPCSMGTCNVANLPVILKSFVVENKDGAALMTWSTATELNNDYFEIERSLDGANFDAIYKVNGAGTTFFTNQYRFTDFYPLPGTSYYRLRQVDFDGTVTVSNVISFQTERSELNLTIFPNPVSMNETISIYNNGEGEQVYWYDVRGRLLATNQLLTGTNIFNLNNELEQGILIVKIADRRGAQLKVERLIVQ